jgi:hypothetical protein
MISFNKMSYIYHNWEKYNNNTIVITEWTENNYILLCFHNTNEFIKSVAWILKKGLDLYNFENKYPNIFIKKILDKMHNDKMINDLKPLIKSYIGDIKHIIQIGIIIDSSNLDILQETLKKKYEFILII